jgi:hypothetical protein
MSVDLEVRVKTFVARERCVDPRRLSLETTLFGDLGTDGADGWELIEAFGKEFDVDLCSFDPSKHFGPECGGNPISLLFWFINEVLLRRESHEVWGLTPISIRDLVNAAKWKRWTI